MLVLFTCGSKGVKKTGKMKGELPERVKILWCVKYIVTDMKLDLKNLC